MDAMLERNKRAMRQLIRQTVPEKKQYFEDYICDDGLNMGPYKIACTMWREGDKCIFDFAGTDPQSISSINFLLNEEMFKMFAGVYMIMVFDPQILFNDGYYDLIDVRIPAGSLLKPKFPAALSGRTHALGRIFDILGGLLGQKTPEFLNAAGFSSSPHLFYSGNDTRPGKGGEWFQLFQIGFGGIPGRPLGDGPDGHSLWPGFTNVPNEFVVDITDMYVFPSPERPGPLIALKLRPSEFKMGDFPCRTRSEGGGGGAFTSASTSTPGTPSAGGTNSNGIGGQGATGGLSSGTGNYAEYGGAGGGGAGPTSTGVSFPSGANGGVAWFGAGGGGGGGAYNSTDQSGLDGGLGGKTNSVTASGGGGGAAGVGGTSAGGAGANGVGGECGEGGGGGGGNYNANAFNGGAGGKGGGGGGGGGRTNSGTNGSGGNGGDGSILIIAW